MELGDAVKAALTSVGVTENRVKAWLNSDSCSGCQERREKLNELSRWSKRVLKGKFDRAKTYLRELIDAD